MFVTLDDGTTVGISLKKDGKVFINNGGWKEQYGKIRENLANMGLSEEELAEFDKASGIDSYKKQLKKEITDGAKKLDSNDPKLKKDAQRLSFAFTK